MSERYTVLSYGPPTTNGPMHIGHLSGPYLAADIVARAARSRGESVLTLGGVDIHQNWVLTRAEVDGVDVEKMIMEYRGRIDEAMHRARIECDVYLDATEDGPISAADLAAELAGSVFPVRDVLLRACADCGRTMHSSYVAGTCSRCGSESQGGSCEGCGGFASAADLIDQHCARCGGQTEAFPASVPVLVMEDYREHIAAAALGGTLPRRFRLLVAEYLRDGLPEIPVAYPTNWGKHGTGALDGLRLDVYFELALNIFRGAARGIDPAAVTLPALRTAWEQVDKLWQFCGIDNGFLMALYIPAVLGALGVPPDRIGGVVSNEFFTLDGRKFSTSRNHAIWADEMLATEDPELVRLYLCWDRPDRYESDFTLASYYEFRDRVVPALHADQLSATQDALADRDLARGLAALRPEEFDAALAVRCLLANAGYDSAAAGTLRAALGATAGE